MPKGLQGFQKGNKIRLGAKHSEESKKKISKSHIGIKLSKETRKKMSLSHKGKPTPWTTGEKNYGWKGGISKDKKYRAELVKKYYRTPKGRETTKKWYGKNKKRKALLGYILRKKKRRNSPKHKLDWNMGTMISVSLKGKKAGRKWEKLVGYTLQDLLNHLEGKFDDKMTWDNYGSYWHIDHIKPKSLFKYKIAEDPEFLKCWSLENLQPLERIANIKKRNKYE